jgi:hypothetical protein
MKSKKGLGENKRQTNPNLWHKHESKRGYLSRFAVSVRTGGIMCSANIYASADF